MKEDDLSRLPQLEKMEMMELSSRESRLLSSLNHPSIPKLVESFFEGERQYLIMEFVRGENLHSRLKKGGGLLSSGEVVELAEKIEEKKRTEIIHPFFRYKATYLRCFEFQARGHVVRSGDCQAPSQASP